MANRILAGMFLMLMTVLFTSICIAIAMRRKQEDHR